MSRRSDHGDPVRGWAAALLRVFDRLVQRLVPPASDLVCYASMPDFTDSAYYQFRHLVETETPRRHLWLVRDPASETAIRSAFAAFGGAERGHRIVVRAWSRPTSYFAFVRAAVVFHTHGAYSFSRPTNGRTTISLWHGMPVKAIRHLHPADVQAGMHPVVGTFHLATSAFFRQVMARAFAVPTSIVLTSGLPRCDVLKGHVTPMMDRKAIRSVLGLENEGPLIVWLPTHRKDGGAVVDHTAGRTFVDDVPADVFHALDEACREHRCTVVVKLHQFDDGDTSVLEREYPSIRTVTSSAWSRTGVQLYDLLAASDGLLTDVSSVLIDYLHTRRPIGIVGAEETAREVIVPMDRLRGCRAVVPLQNRTDAQRFVRRCTESTPNSLPADDVAWELNEDHAVGSCAAVASAAGLG